LNTLAFVGINDDGDTSTPPPPEDASGGGSSGGGGGGAADATTLILLLSLITMSVTRLRRKGALPCPAARGSGHSVPSGAS
jgi:hypothetical protein